MSFWRLHHTNVLQYNPTTSLCIKGLITTSKPTSDQKLRSKQSLWFKGKVHIPPSRMMLPQHRGEYVICYPMVPLDLRC